MNEKTEKQLNSIISDQEKDIKKKEQQLLTIKEEILDLKKDNKKLKSLFRKRETVDKDDITIGGLAEQ